MRTLLFAFCSLLCTCGPAPSTNPEPEARPNVLFILTDDQGIGDLSLHGNDSISTPNIDALLSSSAKFDRFYVSPVCAPTRASFLSGLYHPRTGAISVTRRRETMDDGITTVAEHLSAAGYRTGLYGKWHNGATFPYHPGAQGFDEFLGFTLGHFNDYFEGELRDEADRPVPFKGDLTQILTDSAAHFMTASDEPFFCMLTYQSPHTPVQVADKYWDRKGSAGLSTYNRGIYAMVESIDDRLGQLLDRLDREGKLDNTVVIFCTDNGPNGDRYRMGLKGIKGWVDEGGVRVPFGIRLPAGHPANGKAFDTPAAHIDLLPTLLDYLDLPASDELDGQSLVPLLEGRELEDRYIYSFKHGEAYTGYPGSMRDRRYLYVAKDSSSHELYDLAEDPGQRQDIYTQRPEIGQQMASTYRAFALRIGRPDLTAPPIDLTAGPGWVRLLAHEGEPGGDTRFREGHGWANDFFINLDGSGGSWPITADTTALYRVSLQYHLVANDPPIVQISTDTGTGATSRLPVFSAERLPVADRVERKEVYPYAWAEWEIGELTVEAGASELTLSTPSDVGEFWIKSVRLERID